MKNKKLIALFLALAMMINVTTSYSIYASNLKTYAFDIVVNFDDSNIKSDSKEAGKKWGNDFTFNGKKMQNFVFDGKNYLYVIKKSSNTNHSVILKFKVTYRSNKTTDIATYMKGQYMVIENGGHGETLELLSGGNNPTFLIGCSPNSEGYTTDITKVTFKAATKVNAKNNVCITNFNKMGINKNGSYGSILRTTAGCDNNDVVFRVELTKNGEKYAQYATYKRSDIISALNGKKSINIQNLKAKYSPAVVPKKNDPGLKDNHFQGIESYGGNMIVLNGQDSYIYINTLTQKKAQCTKIWTDKSYGKTEAEGSCIYDGSFYYGVQNNKKQAVITYVDITQVK